MEEELAEDYTEYTLESQIEAAGIHYTRRHDITYRVGFVIQSLGAVAFAVMYFLKLEYSLYALFVFEAGIALSSLFLLVWKAEIKTFILRALVLGLVLQAVSLAGFQYSDRVFILGLGLVLMAGGGLTGKEAYCFGYIEGWLLLLAYPIAIAPNLIAGMNFRFTALAAAVIALLQVSFLIKKLRQPLLKKCKHNVCGLPEQKINPPKVKPEEKGN